MAKQFSLPTQIRQVYSLLGLVVLTRRDPLVQVCSPKDDAKRKAPMILDTRLVEIQDVTAFQLAMMSTRQCDAATESQQLD